MRGYRPELMIDRAVECAKCLGCDRRCSYVGDRVIEPEACWLTGTNPLLKASSEIITYLANFRFIV